MEDFINSLVTVTTYLHPAAIVLKVIWEEYSKIQINRAKLGDLLDRCKRVIGAIDQELSRRPPLDVKKSIDQLLRHLRFIEQLMRSLAELGFFKSLLQREDIAGRIVHGHQRLTDCLTIFQITAAVDLREYQRSLDRARIADQDALTIQLGVLESNGNEVLKKLNVFQNQMEAMMAIQNSLLRRTEESPEERVLQVGLASLQAHTGKKPPKRPPEWAITAYDVEIGES
ncbi:hypothetical protein FRB93_008776 [Tulasnella sp. JGI-2019a]|nr:hypothetical protein FRB93_008776 [Tulasnella sp. JGI-2019a]